MRREREGLGLRENEIIRIIIQVKINNNYIINSNRTSSYYLIMIIKYVCNKNEKYEI